MKKVLVMETGSYATKGGAIKAACQLYDTFHGYKGYDADLLGDSSQVTKAIKPINVNKMLATDYDAIIMNSVRDIIIVNEYLKTHKRTKVFYVDRSNMLLNYSIKGIGGLPPDMAVSLLAMKPVEKLFSSKMLKVSFNSWKKHMTVDGGTGTSSTKLLSSVAIAGADVVKRYLIKSMASWLTCYVAITAEQEQYARNYFKARTKVVYIPIAPDKMFRKLAGKKGQYAVYVGRLEEGQKRVSFLINGIAKVKAQHPELAGKKLLEIVGNGPDEETYRKEVSFLGLEKNIEFTGVHYGESLVKAYNQALFYVSTSFWEGMSRSNFEAMACGLPLLLNNRVNSLIKYPDRRVVTPGYNGLVYQYDNLDDFAEKFYSMYSDRKLRDRCAKNALEMSKESSFDTVKKEYQHLLDTA